MRPSDRYHKWLEWSDEDSAYLGHCPDVITRIHGSDPIRLYQELCKVVGDVLASFQASGRTEPVTKPMRKVA